MPDREKVIKGLETCIKYIDQECPIGCLYYETCTKYEGRVVFQPLLRDALSLLKEQQAETKRLTPSGEWKRMSDLPIEIDDRFECSNCGNVVHYHDRINLYTFNDYCGRCGAYNGFRV